MRFLLGRARLLGEETIRRYDAVESSDNRRCIMAIAVPQIRPVAHLPLVLGVMRRLKVASLIDDLIPPHPAHVLSTGHGVEALGRGPLRVKPPPLGLLVRQSWTQAGAEPSLTPPPRPPTSGAANYSNRRPG